MATTKTLSTKELTPFVGAEVLDVDLDRIQNDDELPGLVLNTLEARGVLLFRELHLDDEAQAAFCHRLGEVRLFPQSPIPEIFEISRRPGNPFSGYTEGAINWHIDGLIDQDLPTKATILSARVTAAEGGETAFASSYAAYDDLTEEEKEQFASLRVAHSFLAARRFIADPTPAQIADWESRGGREHPLVWTHASGRKSLVLGSSADHIVGMDIEESRTLLDDLLQRATTPDRVYMHHWSLGDMVIWDNAGVLHRAMSYADPNRRMHRTTIIGTEGVH